MDYNEFLTLSYQTLIDLATQEGINASSRNEIYGCIFGRDSAITVLKILKAHSIKPHKELLDICRRTLLTLVSLQGRKHNIQSGEEPGKFIHEYRKDRQNYLHLIEKEPIPWYIYEDGALRNYDSIDATPLTLIALYRYYQVTQDYELLYYTLPAVERGLQWLLTYADKDNDNLIEYELHSDRTFGGLRVQSWTDSHESMQRADGTFPNYPIAPIEAQSYAWLAMRLWAGFFQQKMPTIATVLEERAKMMKTAFNQAFLIKDNNLFFGAQALDGDKKKIPTITANPLLCLWATFSNLEIKECILDEGFISDYVARAFQPDLFDEDGGIRTMSTVASTFNPNNDSYHNGSFWPMLNGMIYEGLQNWGYSSQAHLLREASLKPIRYFQTPIELYMKTDDGYTEYLAPNGHKGCKYQAWSAAALLDMVVA